MRYLTISEFGSFLGGGKYLKVNFTKQRQEKIIETVKEIYKICEKAMLPPTPATENQCSQCKYLNFCADRL